MNVKNKHVYKLLFCLFLARAVVYPVPSPQPQNQPPASDAGKTTVTITVTDHDHHPVSGLKAEDFALYEDNQLQQISSVTVDVPACIGLVVDNSSLMRNKLPAVTASLLDFVRSSNSENRVFVINFNDDAYLDQDFTRDIKLIGEALARGKARGGTALYESVSLSAQHLADTRDCQKRVLVVVSDGEDNQTSKTLPQTITDVQNSKHSIVYAIGLEDDNGSTQKARPRHALETLATATGGVSFFLGNVKDIAKVIPKVAEEIRGQYTVTYLPTHPGPEDPRLKVEVSAAGRKNVAIRLNGGVRPDPGR